MMFSIVIVAACPSWWAYQVTHSLLWSGVIATLTTLAWAGWGLWKIRADEAYILKKFDGWVSFEEIKVSLGSSTTAALQNAGLSLTGIRMYCAPDHGAYALSIGRNSIALENETVEEIKAGTEFPLEVAAFIAHEVGHLESARFTRDPWIAWLTLPSLWIARLIRIQLANNPLKPQERGCLIVFLILIVFGVGNLIVQSYLRWVIISLAAVFVWVALLALTAKARRAEEFQADRFAHEHGLGPDLADALRRIYKTRGDSPSSHPLDSYPPLRERIARLEEMDA